MPWTIKQLCLGDIDSAAVVPENWIPNAQLNVYRDFCREKRQIYVQSEIEFIYLQKRLAKTRNSRNNARGAYEYHHHVIFLPS